MTTPWLVFFRSAPNNLSNQETLTSSLQNFESSLFLIALQRFPHALNACASAIESALKGRPGYSKKRQTFQELLVGAQREFPGLAFPQTNLDEFRELRNRFVHHAFSSSDSSVAASALLSTGLPLLISTYDAAYRFDLPDALVPPFGAQLTTAIDVFGRSNQTPLDSVTTLSVLGHLTRWSIRDSMMSPWELEAVDPSQVYDLQLEITERLCDRAERQLDPAWRFDCPVCESPDALVCQLNDEALARKQIELLACFCAECGLRLSPSAGPLLNALCDDAIRGARDAILAEFGIN